MLVITQQFLSYPLTAWAIFLAITIIAAFVGRGRGIFMGHFAVAFAVMWFDVQWIQSEMAAPDWDGIPDQDGVFIIGVVIRVILINALLLPVAFLFRWLSMTLAASKRIGDESSRN